MSQDKKENKIVKFPNKRKKEIIELLKVAMDNSEKDFVMIFHTNDLKDIFNVEDIEHKYIAIASNSLNKGNFNVVLINDSDLTNKFLED